MDELSRVLEFKNTNQSQFNNKVTPQKHQIVCDQECAQIGHLSYRTSAKVSSRLLLGLREPTSPSDFAGSVPFLR
jgi:hypothetical protein